MRLRITLEGRTYEVDVEVLKETPPPEAEVETDALEELSFPPPPVDTRPQDRICRSPIAGAVISVLAVVGLRVRKDDPVAIIEAMKMQVPIGAPLDGTVQEVHVAAGDSVAPGQILCTLA